MTLEQKIGQFFFPAVFINDTEETILVGLPFFIVVQVQQLITKANKKW
jgi:hypothetical protein